MNIRILIVSLFLLFLSPRPCPLQSQQKDSPMTPHATGRFEVKATPLDPAFKTQDNSLGRLSLEKQFHGDLEATSKGEMLNAGSPVKGSGAYVAIERVSDALHTAFNSTQKWCQTPAPVNYRAGEAHIIIKDGKHFYDFACTLAESK